MQLKGIMCFRRRHIGLVELDGCPIESALSVATLALHSWSRCEGGWDHFGLIVRLELRINVRLLLLIRDANCVGGSLGGLERVGYSEGNELTVIAHNFVFEGRPALIGYPFKCCPQNRAEDFPDILA